MNQKFCKASGIDWENGVARFKGNEDVYKMVLKMFLDDATFAHMRGAYDAGDYKMLFEYAHEFKGVTGNTSLTELFDKNCLLVEYLRGGNGNEEEITALFSAVETAYHKTVENVRLCLAE